jgi:hypothetical protein
MEQKVSVWLPRIVRHKEAANLFNHLAVETGMYWLPDCSVGSEYSTSLGTGQSGVRAMELKLVGGWIPNTMKAKVPNKHLAELWAEEMWSIINSAELFDAVAFCETSLIPTFRIHYRTDGKSHDNLDYWHKNCPEYEKFQEWFWLWHERWCEEKYQFSWEDGWIPTVVMPEG